MDHQVRSETTHFVTFTDHEAGTFGRWLLEVCDAADRDLLGAVPMVDAIREFIGELANKLNGVE